MSQPLKRLFYNALQNCPVVKSAIKSQFDFSYEIGEMQKEFTKIGVYENLEKIQNVLKSGIAKLEKSRFESTYNTYSLVSQLISFARSPSGSLISFTNIVNDINNSIIRELSLAEIEFEK